MSGPVARIAAAVSSFGMTEAFQKKPFQNLTTKDDPIAGSGGIARTFGVGGAALGAAIDASGSTGHQITQSIGADTPAKDAKRSAAEREQAALGEASQRQVRAEQEEYARPANSLERARRSALGVGGGRRRASQSLTALGT
jgi:hypothetical protein